MARPTDYTEELGHEICSRVALTRTVVEALDAEGMPDHSTFYRWLTKHPTLRDNYALALGYRAEADNEELRRVAYDMDIPSDHKRIIADTLKWQQARANPKRYGDKQLLGSDPENPLPQNTTITMTDAPEEVLRWYAAQVEGKK